MSLVRFKRRATAPVFFASSQLALSAGAQTAQQVRCVLTCTGVIYSIQKPAAFMAQKDILGNRQIRKKHELLIPSGFGPRTIGGMLTLPGVE